MSKHSKPRIVNLPRLIPHAFRGEVPDIRAKSFWPSSGSLTTKGGDVIGGPSSCLRAQYWKNFGFAKTNPPSDQAICNMENGTAIGIHIVEAAKRLGIYAGDECRIWVPEFDVSGRVDLFVYDEVQDIIPVEIKTVHGYNGRRGVITADKKGKFPFRPKPEHTIQLWIYLDYYYRIELGIIPEGVRKFTAKLAFPYGLMYYHARCNGERAQHVVQVVDTGRKFKVKEGLFWPITQLSINGELWHEATNEMIYERWRHLSQCIRDEKLPDRDWTRQYSTTRVEQLANAGNLNKKDKEAFERGKFVSKGDWQCLASQTRILMENGKIKRAKHIQEGDMTLLGKVVHVKKNPLGSKVMYNVKAHGLPYMHITGDHPVMIEKGKADFEKATDLTEDMRIVSHFDDTVEPTHNITISLVKLCAIMFSLPVKVKSLSVEIEVPATKIEMVTRVLEKALDDATWTTTMIINRKRNYATAIFYIKSCFLSTWIRSKTADEGGLTIPLQLRRMEVEKQNEFIRMLYNIQSNSGLTATMEFKKLDIAVAVQHMGWRCGRKLGIHTTADGYKMYVDPKIHLHEAYVTSPFHHSFPSRYRGMIYDFEIDSTHIIPTIGGSVHNCSYCFAPDTLVYDHGGMPKFIKDVEKGDLLMSYFGQETVSSVTVRKPDTGIVRVRPHGLLPVDCTIDHRFLTANWRSTGDFYCDKPPFIEWEEAGALSAAGLSTRLMMKVLDDKKTTRINRKRAWLLGIYVAEGHLAGWCKNGTPRIVSITTHENESEKISKFIAFAKAEFDDITNVRNELKIDKRHDSERISRQIHISSVEFCRFIRTYIKGNRAHLKKVTEDVTRLPKDLAIRFLAAAWRGDGSKASNGLYTLNTSSRILCLQYQMIAWRLGILACAQLANKPKMLDGYECRQGYRIVYMPGSSHMLRFLNINNHKFVVASINGVDNIEQIPTVIDLTMEGFPCFQTEGGLVHNCDYRDKCWDQISMDDLWEGVATNKTKNVGLEDEPVSLMEPMKPEEPDTDEEV